MFDENRVEDESERFDQTHWYEKCHVFFFFVFCCNVVQLANYIGHVIWYNTVESVDRFVEFVLW